MTSSNCFFTPNFSFRPKESFSARKNQKHERRLRWLTEELLIYFLSNESTNYSQLWRVKCAAAEQQVLGTWRPVRTGPEGGQFSLLVMRVTWNSNNHPGVGFFTFVQALKENYLSRLSCSMGQFRKWSLGYKTPGVSSKRVRNSKAALSQRQSGRWCLESPFWFSALFWLPCFWQPFPQKCWTVCEAKEWES